MSELVFVFSLCVILLLELFHFRQRENMIAFMKDEKHAPMRKEARQPRYKKITDAWKKPKGENK